MARQSLGKGLGALIRKTETRANPLEEAIQDKDRVVLAAESEIVASPFQPRRHFNEEQIAELADSIRESGLMQPLIVRRVNGKFELIAGERRLRAIRSLGQKEAKVIVMEASDQEVAEMTLIENLQREDLTPLEEASQYRLLQTQFGMKQETIAQHVGKSRAVVANMVRLLEMAPKSLALLENGDISVGHAKVLLQLKEAEMQEKAAEQVARKGLTVRQTEQLVKAFLHPAPEPASKSAPTHAALPAAYEQICRQLSSDFGTDVNISLKGKSNGVIEIPYVGRDELVRILQIFGISADL